MYNMIFGYLIVINIISMIFMYIEAKTKLIKLKDGTINLIYIILTILGGCVGVLVTSQLLEYKQDEKLIKKIVPAIVFVEVVIFGYIIYKQYA